MIELKAKYIIFPLCCKVHFLYITICPNIKTVSSCLWSDQIRSVTQSCPTLWDPMNCSTPASLSITNSRSSLQGLKLIGSKAGNSIARKCWWIWRAALELLEQYVSRFKERALPTCLWEVFPSFHCLAFHLSTCREFSTSTEIVLAVRELCHSNKICWSPNPQPLRLRPYWDTGSL